jgi:hypothetical protein
MSYICDCCAKAVDDNDYITDDEVCQGSDDPGFFLCSDPDCLASREGLSVMERRRLFGIGREKGQKQHRRVDFRDAQDDVGDARDIVNEAVKALECAEICETREDFVANLAEAVLALKKALDELAVLQQRAS